MPTPLFYEGKFYILNGRKRKLYCVNPADGAVVWSGDLGSKSDYQCSPTAADGKIYVMNFNADVSVVQAGGSEFKLLHTANFKDEGDATRHRRMLRLPSRHQAQQRPGGLRGGRDAVPTMRRIGVALIVLPPAAILALH